MASWSADDQSLVKQYRWRVGYWLSEKKLKKMNFEEFTRLCKLAEIELVQINLNNDLESQGPYDAIFHKLSDFLVLSDQGDTEASLLLNKLENYLAQHPEIVLLDPLPSVRRLCDRYQQYSLIQEVCRTDDVYTPNFVDLTSKETSENLEKLKHAGVKFPFISKPIVAHGTEFAHLMSIIFCEEGVKDVEPPSVAQTFIPHNAVLYKVFVLGDRFFVLARPSLKNFQPGSRPTIAFDSHEVSKEGCSSSLSELDDEVPLEAPPLSDEKIAAVVRDIRKRTDISLFGLDVIVETTTGFHYIIDVNTFPSYDGVADFYKCLVELIVNALKEKEKVLSSQSTALVAAATALRNASPSMIESMVDSGVGSCTESDSSDSERKLKEMRIRETSLTEEKPTLEEQQPSWNRIKRFYGIPKPPTKPRSGTIP